MIQIRNLFLVALFISLSVLGVGCEQNDQSTSTQPEVEVEENQTSQSAEPDSLRVLFIGNSLTYYNDLPGMLAFLLVRGGVAGAHVESIALPNFGLIDHWTQSRVRSTITNGDWDYVIMQQGPSATQGRPYLLDYAERFNRIIRDAGAIPAIYMVWPPRARFYEFELVLESHQTAAELIDGIFLPAGQAWRTAWAEDDELVLYSGDQFHPGPLGSYLAALVIYEGLTGLDPRELPAEFPPGNWLTEFSEDEIRLLQRAAHETSLQFAVDEADE